MSECSSKLRLRAVRLGFGWLLALGLPSLLAGNVIEIDAVRVGWSGTYAVGRWTPVSIDVSSDMETRAHLEIAALDGEGVRYEMVATELELVPGHSSFAFTLRLGSNAEISVRLIAEGGDEVGRTVPTDAPHVTSWQQLVVSIGSDIDIGTVAQYLRRPVEETIVGVHLANSDHLPDDWYAFAGIDALVITTSDAAWLESLTSGQQDAVLDWVRHGGRVVVCLGRNAERLTEPGAILEAFSPGRFQRLVTQRQTTALEGYADSPKRLDLMTQDASGRFAGIPSPVFEVTGAVTLVEEGFGRERSAWIIRKAYGLGLVTVLLFDIDQAPFAEWPARSRLLGRILADILPGSTDSRLLEADVPSMSQLGYRDLTGQLRSALDHFPGVRPLSFPVIAGLAGLLLLLIGPGDYFVLRRIVKRMHWTWLSFPIMVVAMCVGIIGLAWQWKGTALQTNAVHLLDLGAEHGEFRGTSWFHTYAPRTQELQLDLTVNTGHVFSKGAVDGRMLSWQGLPGNGFGGMESPARYGAFLEPYQLHWRAGSAGPHVRVERLRMPAWSSRSFSGMWWGTVTEPLDLGRLTVTADTTLRGTITNPLRVALRDSAICFGRWYYEIGKWEPGASFSLDAAIPGDMRSRLTRRLIVDQTREVTSHWDPESRDIGRIMEMFMFHDAAGGRTGYTDMLHRFEGQLDMSALIQTQRAVLYGRIDDGLCRITVEGDAFEEVQQQLPHHFCRIVIPVEGVSGGSQSRLQSPRLEESYRY